MRSLTRPRPKALALAGALLLGGTSAAHGTAPGHSRTVADVEAPKLIELVRSTDFAAAREALREGADANVAGPDGMSALHWAARAGDAPMVEMLIQAGADLRATTRLGGYTPLLLAAEVGASSAVRALLERGADANQAAQNGVMPLMLAARSGSAPTVEALLAFGASVDVRESHRGQTALMFAADAGRTEVVRTLLESGADPELETNVFDAEAFAAQDRKLRMQKFAELAKRNEEAKRKAAEAEAAQKATDDTEKDAGETGARGRQGRRSGNGEGESAKPVQTAAGGNNDPTQDDRLRSGEAKKRRWWQRKKEEEEPPRPVSYGQLVGQQGGHTALHYAARQGHLETAVALLDEGALVNHASGGDGTTPLLMAIVNGRFDLAMKFLERGADTCMASDAGATPLYAAINVQWAPNSFYPQPSPAQERTSYLELMRELLERGTDPDARLERKIWYTGFNFDQSGADETGATAFWRAAQAADVAAMKLLLEFGADPRLSSVVVPERTLPNGRNFDAKFFADAPKIGEPAISPFQVASGAGYNANFHRIAPGGFLPALRFFVEEIGVDVNAPDSKGYTPLHNAAARGDDQAILYLLLRGADVTAVSYVGETVADMANGPVQRIQPFPKTLAFLEAMGSKNSGNCVSC